MSPVPLENKTAAVLTTQILFLHAFPPVVAQRASLTRRIIVRFFPWQFNIQR